MRNLTAITLACLVAYCAIQTFGLLRTSVHNIRQIVGTSEEQRKGRTYELLGYDYVRDITAIIPESQIFPATRYTDYTQGVGILLPFQIQKFDDRVLIGIRLLETDFTEQRIATATSQESSAVWVFHTSDDYDTLSGMAFLTKGASIPQMKLTLYDNISKYNQIGSWTINKQNVVHNRYFFRLPYTLNKFSFHRGDTDFILKLEAMSPSGSDQLQEITSIETYGIKVNLQDYTVIHRKGTEFTAIKNEFLETIKKAGRQDWLTFLKTLHYE